MRRTLRIVIFKQKITADCNRMFIFVGMRKNEPKNRKSGLPRRRDDWDESRYDGYDEEADEQPEAPTVELNEAFLQAFVNEFQPEEDESAPDVRALSMGELREILQIYRTYDSKSPDPLPYYLSLLASHGFAVRIGYAGEQVVLVSQRNKGRGMVLEAQEKKS